MQRPAVRLVTSEPACMDLQPAWDALYERLEPHTTIYQSWSWNYSWLGAFRQHVDALVICVLEAGEDLAGVLPLVIHRSATSVPTGRCAQFMGAWHSDYHDWLVEPKMGLAFLEQVIEQLQAMNITRLLLTDLPDWSLLPPTISLVAARSGLPLSSGVSAVCPWIGLPAAWPDYVASRSAKMRQTILTAQRHAIKHQASFHTCGSANDLARYQAGFFELHDRWWRKKAAQVGEQSVLAQPEMRQFIGDVTERLFAKNVLRFSIQEIGSEMISAFIAFRQRQTLAYYLSGINPDYASYSPGVAHLARLITDAIDQGYRAFDFLRGNEAYKSRWTNDCNETCWYELQLAPEAS